MTPRAPLLIADLAVKIGGVDLPRAACQDLIAAEVHDDVEAPSVCTLRIMTWDSEKLELSWVDSDLFSIGAEVEVSLGYDGELTSIFDGEITSLELEVGPDALPLLIVRGADRRHRLLRGDKTRSFGQMKDSDIAAQIAREQGLVPEVTDSKTVHPYVLQHAQTDLAFLRGRASAIGYEVVVAGKTLSFRPHQTGQKPSISLSTRQDVIELQARMTSRGQVGEVGVRGWDPDTKQAIVASSTSASLAAMGGTVGPAAVDRAFGASSAVVVDDPVSSQEEADQRAASRLGDLALGYVSGAGTSVGRADLRAGTTIELTGLGRRFSGPYYVISAVHSYSAKQGYRTGFDVRRNAT